MLEAVREPDFLAAASRLGETLRERLEALADARPEIGEVRGLGPMIAFELAERTPDRAKAIVDAAFERRPAAARVRHLRQRDPAAPGADDLRRGAGGGTDPARGVARGGRWLALRRTSTSASSAAEAIRGRRGRGRGRPRHRARRVLHDARPVGLGQDDDAADDRRLRAAGRGADRARRHRRLRPAAVRPAGQHRLPGLRAVPAHDRPAERRVRPAGARRCRRPSAARGRARCSRSFGSRGSAGASRPSSRAGSGSASRSRARSSTRRGRCCSTSRSARST